jgi:RNA polymerase sigma factor (sigma-70 family)
MSAHRDPVAAARLAEHHGEALAVARRKYPGLRPDDHHDIVQEALARVLARLQRGPLDDPRSYLLRVVYTTGAALLKDRHRQVLSLDDRGDDQADELDGIELHLDRSTHTASIEERAIAADELRALAHFLRTEVSSDEARALLLRSVESQTPAEIAEAMQVSVRHYRNLRERAGRRLAVRVDRHRNDDALLGYALGIASRDERERAEALLATFEGRAALSALRARLNLDADVELEAIA